MNNVGHLFSSLKGFVKNSLDKNNKHDFSSWDMNDESQVGPKYREEDGFLVVGETRSEIMAVETSQFNSQCGLDAPPTYSQVSPLEEELPTYRAAIDRGMSITESQTTAAPSFNHDYLLPISGVPFVLAPPLALQYEIIQSEMSSETFIPRTFTWSKYQYDFNFERSYLRDNSVNNNCVVSQPASSFSGGDLIRF